MTMLTAGASAGRLGGSFAANTSLALGGLTLVTPAQNLNGVYLRSVTLIASANGTAIMGGTAAPSSYTSNPLVLLAPGAAATPTVNQRDYFFPPGQGVYVYTNVAGGQVYANYDIL